MTDAETLEHSIDRTNSAIALGTAFATGAIMTSISMSPSTSSLSSIFAGTVAGGVAYFGLNYFGRIQLALEKTPAEKLEAKRKILKFGPVQAFALAMTMSGSAAILHNVNDYAHTVYNNYQNALNDLPAMDPDSIQPDTNATARETFCSDYMTGKALVRRFDGEMMSLNCSVQ